MGTGPFKLGEYVPGSHVTGTKNPDYFVKGLPYLDAFRGLFIVDGAARVAAFRGGRVAADFVGATPLLDQASLKQALGDKLVIQKSPWSCVLTIAFNHEKKPFDDPRVRRALSLALDRWEGSKHLSKITIMKEVGGLQVPGTPYAASEAEVTRLAGFGKDIEANRREARRLLREAGVPDGFSFVFTNRNLPEPYEPATVWLLDQWRRIGLNVTQRVMESSAWFSALRSGDYDMSIAAWCGYIVEPDLDLAVYLSSDKADGNYGRYTDRVLDGLYEKQARSRDPEERKRHIREFEKRLLDEQTHVVPLLWWHRVVPHNSRVRGWTITPSHYLNGQLDTVWLAPE
jgi:peptide/nickel transport system substrate-binding protein